MEQLQTHFDAQKSLSFIQNAKFVSLAKCWFLCGELCNTCRSERN